MIIYAATQPDTFRIQRAATIKAPPERIFAVLNDFLRWESWSPFEAGLANLKTVTENQPR